MRHPLPLAALALALAASGGRAHYHMLLPDKPSAKKGEEVTVTFQFGHPFEHQLSPMAAPENVTLVGPDGKELDVTKSVKQVALPAGKDRLTGYRLTFTPRQRGDYVLGFTSAPTYLEEGGELLYDTVKVVIHVQAQKGWDRLARGAFEWRPLTRPYGLLPGAVFQARLVLDGRKLPRGDVPVEVERYNPRPPKELPDDEFITRVVKTDENGVATTALPEAGWWALTAAYENFDGKWQGKPVKVRRRSTLWVYVNPSAPKKPAE